MSALEFKAYAIRIRAVGQMFIFKENDLKYLYLPRCRLCSLHYQKGQQSSVTRVFENTWDQLLMLSHVSTLLIWAVMLMITNWVWEGCISVTFVLVEMPGRGNCPPPPAPHMKLWFKLWKWRCVYVYVCRGRNRVPTRSNHIFPFSPHPLPFSLG